MVNVMIMASIIIGVVAVIVFFALYINQWIKNRMFRENDDAIPLFNCSIASRGNGTGIPSAISN